MLCNVAVKTFGMVPFKRNCIRPHMFLACIVVFRFIIWWLFANNLDNDHQELLICLYHRWWQKMARTMNLNATILKKEEMDKAKFRECLQHYQLRSHLTKPFQTHLRRLVFKDMHLQDIARPNWHPNVDLSSHSCLRWHTPPTQTNHAYLLHIIIYHQHSNIHFHFFNLNWITSVSFLLMISSPRVRHDIVRHSPT